MKYPILLAISLAACSLAAHAETLYVDPKTGNDAASGSKSEPLKTIADAIRRVDGTGGEIHLNPHAGFYREPILIRKGGTPENPLIIDGEGAVINLGLDITKGPWVDTGDGYRLEREFNKKPETGNYQTTPVFINGLGILGDHPKGPSYAPRAWHGGYIRLDEAGHLVVVFPTGLSPKNSVIVLAGGPDWVSCGVQMSNASHIVIRNLTCCFATNDGFNFHGNGSDVVLEKVKAVFNADEGVSAHETYEVEVHDSELAFNGSQGGGAQDIQQSVTNYKNVRSHQNRASGFALQGKSHLLEGDVSYGNGGYNLPKPAANLVMNDNEDKGALPREIPVLEDPSASADSAAPVEEADRLGRFLQLRPPAE